MGVEFVNVTVDTTGLYPVAARDYGTVAIVGEGSSGVTTPVKIGSYAEAESTFADTDLGKAVKLALLNGASSVWTVDIATKDLTNVEEALAKLDNIDVQIVCIANTVEAIDNTYISTALADHVNAAGTDRVGVFMLDNGEDASTMPSAIGTMLSANSNKMFGVAHKSTSDVAAAVAGLLAGIKPWESPILKPLTGVEQTESFTTTQLSGLDSAQINTIVNPVYMGTSVYVLGTDYTLGSSASGITHVDIRRVIDDISYKLKAGLTNPNVIGTLRINKAGLSELSGFMAGILGNAVTDGEIESSRVVIPVLNALAKEPTARSEAEETLITNARTSRVIESSVVIEYSGTVHSIDVNLKITV